MNKPLRAAVFGHTGLGDYGHGHDLSLQLHPQVTMAGVADPDRAGAEETTRRVGGTPYTDHKQLLAAEKPDLVCIAQREVGFHAEQIEDCTRYGVKGILCEKPLVATLAEADRVLHLCAEAGTHLVVAHRKASGYELHARDMVRNGAIGEIRELRGRGKGDHRAGGQDLAVLGPHILDSMRWFVGADPLWAIGQVARQGKPVTAADAFVGHEGIGLIAGDRLTGLFMFPGGIPATFTSYAVEAEGHDHSGWFGFEVYGTKGALSIRNSPDGMLYHCTHGMAVPGTHWERIHLPDWEEEKAGQLRSGQAKILQSNRIMVEELVAAVTEGKPITRACTGQDARWALEMGMAIHESHLSGNRVALPLQQRQNPYAVRQAPD